MRKSALWLAVSLTIAASACVRTATNEATGAVDVDVESPTKVGEDWSGTLTGQGMFTSVRGNVSALVVENRTTFTVTLEGATPGASYTWDVREGRCGANGLIVGGTSWYTTLTAGNDGKAGTTVELTARLDEAKDYAASVYSSSNNTTSVVACGDLDD